MEVLTIILTSVFSYISLFILTRLMGHKQVSQLDFFDYVTGITIGSIAAEFATELEAPWKPFLSMVIYAMATILLGFIERKVPRSRKYLNGTSSIIIDNGKLNRENMKKAKLDLDEFLMMCREKGYFDLSSIHTALFECNGKLSILPTSTRRPATPEDFQLDPAQESLFAEIIMDWRIIEKTCSRWDLISIGLQNSWNFIR
jgi:uncharacterized membrane protein YcaP (DUF421 family)